MLRSISVTAFAAFVALGTQSAFAGELNREVAATPAPAVAEAAAPAMPAARAASSASISGTRSARVRHTARIPGTFALNENPSASDLREEQFRLHVLFPALSGDGGG